METEALLPRCNRQWLHLRKELLSERDGNNCPYTASDAQLISSSGRNYSLKEMETHLLVFLFQAFRIHLRKELLSERDGNILLNSVHSHLLYKSSGRNYSLKEMETRPSASALITCIICLRKELLSERDGNPLFLFVGVPPPK